MLSDPQRLAAVALSGKIVGTLFYHAPHSAENETLLAMLAGESWVAEWPYPSETLPGIASQIARGIKEGEASLRAEHQRLFIGPYALPAPPWGSVYLDKENVLFGDSMLELRQWMRGQGFAPQLDQNEPDDHFGLLLMLAAWLAEGDRQQPLDELLAWHLLPWAERYLTLFAENTSNDFYSGVGKLAKMTLSDWKKGMIMPVASKEIHF